MVSDDKFTVNLIVFFTMGMVFSDCFHVFSFSLSLVFQSLIITCYLDIFILYYETLDLI